MLELVILGFLYDERLHGYDLRKRIAALTGHVRPIADGTLYPLLKRMEAAGLLTRELQPGQVAAPRHMLSLTSEGRKALLDRLREPDELFITDENRWFALLAFLHHLDDPAAQAAVLQRRLDFLTQPASFFWDGDRPLRAADFDDPFRQGLFTIATATTRTELKWLRETLATLTQVS
ncbi:PadR family transcriptional regulator [Micromonospora sp. 4G57]|uniref:PadR family transcriptional regulator n=1 Tax=Micromonospora sicca TaxID=2202420 RepID=A0ABU5JKK2_9ACTN|nr:MULTISPECIES: PadR family transcriptional regulator [unclassified Micromonospora]MDZ5443343.1 PadR family transcriptional regulator [Micromonospora sp. 4G57]MDZ5493162.1 PadR family transcriptional regulator [Micromonospora sp. 4G53]